MKFSKIGHVSLVSGIALILAGTFTACNPITIDYVFIAANQDPTVAGQIETFLADRVSGALSKVGSVVSSGGKEPVSMVTSTDYQHLYVANKADNTLVEFSIGANGGLTSLKTTTLSAEGTGPVSIGMNGAGTLLYVANTFRPGCSSSSPCGGALAVFPVGTDGSLGSSVTNGGLHYVPVGVNPTGVSALADGNAVYVTTYDPAAGLGYVSGFSATSSGALAALLSSPYPAGVHPSAIATDPTSRLTYVTDFAQNQLIAYTIIDQGVLHALTNGPFRTGSEPTAITVDPRGKFIYVPNALDNTVSSYAIDLTTGTPTASAAVSGSSSNSTGTQPVAILVDPSFGRYVYAVNQLDNSLTGFQLNPSTGVLSATQNGPYPSINAPVAIAAVPHGNHSIQVNQP